MHNYCISKTFQSCSYFLCQHLHMVPCTLKTFALSFQSNQVLVCLRCNNVAYTNTKHESYYLFPMLAVLTPFLWVDWGKGWFNLQGKQGLAHLCAKLQETRSVYTDRKYRKNRSTHLARRCSSSLVITSLRFWFSCVRENATYPGN